MSIWELPKEHYNWESPITKIYGDIHNEIVRQDEENCTFAIEQEIGYRVDKEELIKTLQYDREQYDKGYRDGVRETFVKELENIWDEIRALPDINPDYPMDKTIHISRYGVQEIIYKHIAELKGEDK